MPFKSKAQQRFMFARHPRIAKRWAREMKAGHQSIKSLPEKTAETPYPANYWLGKDTVRRLEGTGSGPGLVDKKLPPNGFGTMYGTGHSKKAFDLAFADEVCKIAAGPSRIKAVQMAQRAAPIVAKRIRGIRRTLK